MTDNAITRMVDQSIRKRGDDEVRQSPTLLFWLTAGEELVAPWWSETRDADLRRFWRQVDPLAGAVYTLESRLKTIPFRVQPKDMRINAHIDQSERFQALLENASEFGEGWGSFYSKWTEDLLTQDKGAFAEIIGDGDVDGPIQGAPYGIAHLDAARCVRTNSAEFPVIFRNREGERFKLHHTRVAYASQMTSPAEEMNGVGFCAVSRCLNIAQNLLDILKYKQEKLGSRPHRNIIVTQGGLDPDDVKNAFDMADETMDNQMLTRYSRSVVVGSGTLENADLNIIDLASLPDGFNETDSFVIGMASIALAFGVDARELFPAMSIGATRADALISHLKSRLKGIGEILEVTEKTIGPKFLPPSLEMIFDYQDDAQDRQVAEIRKLRNENNQIALKTGTIDMRTAREQMLEAGDLTQAQFDALELRDGRLSDGTSVLTLFFDPQYETIFGLGIPDPLSRDLYEASVIEELTQTEQDRLLELLATTGNMRARERYHQAIAALDALIEYHKSGDRELEEEKPDETIVVEEEIEPTEEEMSEETEEVTEEELEEVEVVANA